jgi:hypothetical protein
LIKYSCQFAIAAAARAVRKKAGPGDNQSAGAGRFRPKEFER